MIEAYACDVGDGMAIGIGLLSGQRIQIDCGSQQAPTEALSETLNRIEPETFVLSHFHADHYNGLFPHPTHQNLRLHIRSVFFPRIPEFQERPRFARCLFAVNERVLGGVTGSMEMDFLNLLSRINRCPFSYRPLSAGDTFRISGSVFHVLWPPRSMSNDATIQVIRSAIEDFDSAMKEDPILREIYQGMEDGGIFRHYFGEQEEEQSYEHRCRKQEDEAPETLTRQEDLPSATIKANESLRAAANHFSLAFREDNRLLFLGDLEKHELKPVVTELCNEGIDRFHLLITPHHGTHWHSSLSNLQCFSALSTVGPKLFKHLCSEYKKVTKRWYVTYLTGNIGIPITTPWTYHPLWAHRHRRVRHWFPWP